MDADLKTLYNNFLEYATTGSSKYKTAYESAQQRIEARLPDSTTSTPDEAVHKTSKRHGNTSFIWQWSVLGILGGISIGLMTI